MKNVLRIPLDNGKEIIAELCNYDGNHPEINVYIRKNENDGVIMQDICIVRPHEEDGIQSGDAECLVWGDECSEDYTDKFVITQYEE